MSQNTITATVNEQVLQKRLSFHLSALYLDISIGKVAAATEQNDPLSDYPTLILTSPSPSDIQNPNIVDDARRRTQSGMAGATWKNGRSPGAYAKPIRPASKRLRLCQKSVILCGLAQDR